MAIVSSFTLDSINGKLRIGGPAYYSTVAILHYCDDDLLVIGPASRVHKVLSDSIGVHLISTSEEVPLFELRYVGNDNNRVVRLIKSGEKVVISDNILEDLKGSLIIVNPVYREVPITTIQKLKSVAYMLALDLQGLVREVNNDGIVSKRWNCEVFEAMKLADIVHADLSEAPAPSDAITAAKLLSEKTAGLVIVSMGANGLVAIHKGKAVYVPALPNIKGDPTGTGDILLSIVACELIRGSQWLTSIARGVAAAGLKVSRSRPPWFSRHEVEVLSEKLVNRSKHIQI